MIRNLEMPCGIDDSLLKGPRSNATSSLTWWDLYEASSWVGNAAGVSSWNILSVARDACITPIEEWGCTRVVRPQSPVIVRQVSLVSALVSQRLLPSPHEVTVPGQEISLSTSANTLSGENRRTNITVGIMCQQYVGHHEVIVTTLHTAGNRCRIP